MMRSQSSANTFEMNGIFSLQSFEGDEGGRLDLTSQPHARSLSGLSVISPVLAALLAFSAPTAILAETAPAGMVPYDHPVFHNGKRVLWHGTWRGTSAKKAGSHVVEPAKTEAAKAPDPAPDPVKTEPTKAADGKPAVAKVGDFSILVDVDDAYAGRMANDLITAMKSAGGKGRLVAGRTSQSSIAHAVTSDAADLAITPIVGPNETPDWLAKTPYIARLGTETVEVITPQSITQISQLQGRKVAVGAADGASATTATVIFAKLGIAATFVNETTVQGLADLVDRKVDAVVLVGAKSSKIVGDFGKDGKYHLAAVAWTPELKMFSPAVVASSDRPHLVGPEEKIETLAIPMALIALDAPAGSLRATKLAPFATHFLEAYDELVASATDPSWRDVNLAATAPKWNRLAAAQEWVEKTKSSVDSDFESFRSNARSISAAGPAPDPADADRLYEALTKWRQITH